MDDRSHSGSSVVSIANGSEFADGDEPPSSPPIVPIRPATPPGPTSPTATGTTGAGSRRTPSARPAARRPARLLARGAASHRHARGASTSSPSRRTTSRSSTRTTPTTRSGSSRSPRRSSWPRPPGTELEDPLEEDKDSPVPGLTHRYPDRALLVTTHVCTMYCRFCTRKRATMVRGGWDAVSRDDERMVEYVRDHPEIRDVIVSGGDPLTLPAEQARVLPREPGGHRPRRRHPHRHPRPGHAAAAALRPRADRPAGRLGQGVDPDALQPPARDHARGRAGSATACGRPACRSTTTPSCSRASTTPWTPCAT